MVMHVLTCAPREPGPLKALVTFRLAMSGAAWPSTVVSRKWLIRNISVDESPFDLFTRQSKVGSVTSNLVSQMFVNSANAKLE